MLELRCIACKWQSAWVILNLRQSVHGSCRNGQCSRIGLHMSQSGGMGRGCIHASRNARQKIWQQEGEVTNFKGTIHIS